MNSSTKIYLDMTQWRVLETIPLDDNLTLFKLETTHLPVNEQFYALFSEGDTHIMVSTRIAEVLRTVAK